MIDAERDGLYLRLIAEMIDDIQRRMALGHIQEMVDVELARSEK